MNDSLISEIRPKNKTPPPKKKPNIKQKTKTNKQSNKKTKQTKKTPPKITESFLFRKRHGDTETEDLANIAVLHDFNTFYISNEKINL